MQQYCQERTSAFALVVCLACLSGCQHLNQASGLEPGLGAKQVADVQVALGRTLEKQGDPGQAAQAYSEALKHDPTRADACLRLAILYDQEGKFNESLEYFQKALAAQPGSPDIFCDMGYSLYLQRRWAEAEMNLRQALALKWDHSRAHNNLALVLAHVGRDEEALVEFTRSGCGKAAAHANVAFVRLLENSPSEARYHYQAALEAEPSLEAAKKGLQELDALTARLEKKSGPTLPPSGSPPGSVSGEESLKAAAHVSSN